MGVSLVLNGSVKDGMSGDVVTSSQKNMNGWVESGTGTVTLTYADGVNSFEFENASGMSITQLINEIKRISGRTITEYQLNGNGSQTKKLWQRYGDHTGYATFSYYQSDKYGLIAYDNTNGDLYCDTTGGDFIIKQVGDGSCNMYVLMWNVDSTSFLSIYGGSPGQETTPYRPGSTTYYTGFDNIASQFGIDKSYSLTLATEANKKYILTFGVKTSTGFTTGADAIKITNGLTTETLSLDGTSSNDFTGYKILFTAETTSVTIELDLSAIQSSSDIELDIKNVSFYEIGVAGGGGGGGGSESVTEDFSFQCVSAYPDTHEGATASRVVNVDNSDGYAYLQFDWSSNGSATGYGWIQGQYTFNGVTTQLYFQQNSASDVGGTVKLGISGLGTEFSITFTVNSTTGYQYSISTAKLNISNVILTNE